MIVWFAWGFAITIAFSVTSVLTVRLVELLMDRLWPD